MDGLKAKGSYGNSRLRGTEDGCHFDRNLTGCLVGPLQSQGRTKLPLRRYQVKSDGFIAREGV